LQKKIAASVLAVSMLLAGTVQNVLAVDKVSAREAVINAQTAAVVQAAAQLNVPMNPELRQRLNHPALPRLAPALTAVKPAKKKPVSRGSFGTIDVQKVIRVAVSLTGTPYKRSGQTPGGFDCSGFTMYAFKAGAGIDLPHSSAEQAQYGTAVSKSDLAPGDLVFFNTSGSGISHVGIYIGGDNFISASSSKGVTVSNINDAYWGKRYLSARRLAN
jgi:cell wall-associated NlpC family hydrolase